LKAVTILLASRADIYALDHRQWSPLHYASYNGHRLICNLLLKWDADKDKLRDLKNSQNKQAFIIAKDPQTKEGFQHIWRASQEGKLDTVRVLLREGQNVNEKTIHLGNPPLHIAAKHGHYLLVKFLLENGANVKIGNREGLTAYDFAQQAKTDLELKRASAKNKVGGPDFDPRQLQLKLDDYTKILTLMKKHGMELAHTKALKS